MTQKRMYLMAAGGLVLATALVGAVARGTGGAPPPPNTTAATSFAAGTGGPVSFHATLDRKAVLLGGDGTVRMELVLAAKGDPAAVTKRRPTDMVLVLDRSGSMSGEKIEHAKAAVRALIGQLGPGDRFGLVTYSSGAEVAIPLGTYDADVAASWVARVAQIGPAGGTNMSSGLDQAFALIDRNRDAEHVPHVVLLSDGLANEGDPSPEGLRARAQRAARGEFMLSTVGVGVDFNEYLMTALADAGTGNFYFLENARDLATVFARELDAARTTVATGLAVQIDPAPGVRVVDAAGYPLETTRSGVLFRPGSLFAGQERRIWVTLAAPQESLGEYELGKLALSYGEGSGRTTLALSETPRIACVEGAKQFYSSIDVDTWGRSVVVDSYNKMQNEVAREVKEGRRDAALAKLRAFKDEAGSMNAHLSSTPVAEQLKDADRLEAEVKQAFEGENQPQRQNSFSKAAAAKSVDSRRVGNKK